MTAHIITSQESLQEAAVEFLTRLEKSMEKGSNSKEGILLAMDELYTMLTEVSTNSGWIVKMDPSVGTTFDIFDGYEKADWDKNLYNSDWDFSNFKFYNTEEAAISFLSILGYQVLNNVPETKEEAIRHMKLNVASLFNGANRFSVKFDLHYYTDCSLFDEGYGETLDIGDQLIVI